jgi:ABC-type branched-subunit amino acid transport system ATPase component
VSEIALSARGLYKSFGSLVVASDIELTLPAGARYALIGPNGAGKTTLINLMTGILRPDAGRIVLDGVDITGQPPEQRVKRGLVRTFQINALFPHLTALESVTLAVCERTRAVRTWWRKVSAYRHEIDEAYDILAALSLTAVCHRPTRELAYGQQRLLEIALAMATRPKVLLLDEPAAGVPREDSAELFEAIAGLSREITVLFIEHDMELVFRFASRVIVLVGGACWSKARRTKSPPTRKCARSISAGRWERWRMAEPLIAFGDVRAGYGSAVVLDGVSFALPERGSLAVLGRNGVGKSTLMLTIMGYTQIARGRIAWRGEAITRRPSHRRALSGIGWVAQEREIFTTLTVEENLNVAARAGRWDLAAVYDLFPRLAERRRNLGNQLSGGEQQMLAIARALMTNPALLLLDEPLEGLAPIVVEELAAAIQRMASEDSMAFILVEQHADIALSLTQNAIVLERGRVVYQGGSASLLADHTALDRLIGLRLAEV